jgi:hypothetical protein
MKERFKCFNVNFRLHKYYKNVHLLVCIKNKGGSGGLSPPDFDLFPKLKKTIRGKRFRSIEEVSNEVT